FLVTGVRSWLGTVKLGSPLRLPVGAPAAPPAQIPAPGGAMDPAMDYVSDLLAPSSGLDLANLAVIAGLLPRDTAADLLRAMDAGGDEFESAEAAEHAPADPDEGADPEVLAGLVDDDLGPLRPDDAVELVVEPGAAAHDGLAQPEPDVDILVEYIDEVAAMLAHEPPPPPPAPSARVAHPVAAVAPAAPAAPPAAPAAPTLPQLLAHLQLDMPG
ncbi:unnamed protein product, partial [Prorocentrum cordatum]